MLGQGRTESPEITLARKQACPLDQAGCVRKTERLGRSGSSWANPGQLLRQKWTLAFSTAPRWVNSPRDWEAWEWERSEITPRGIIPGDTSMFFLLFFFFFAEPQSLVLPSQRTVYPFRKNNSTNVEGIRKHLVSTPTKIMDSVKDHPSLMGAKVIHWRLEGYFQSAKGESQ